MPVDITEDKIRIRVKDPGAFQKGALKNGETFATLTLGKKSEGIKAVIGKLKGKTGTSTQSYLFNKKEDIGEKVWTKSEAKAWVKKHKEKSVEDMIGRGILDEFLDEIEEEVEEEEIISELEGDFVPVEGVFWDAVSVEGERLIGEQNLPYLTREEMETIRKRQAKRYAELGYEVPIKVLHTESDPGETVGTMSGWRWKPDNDDILQGEVARLDPEFMEKLNQHPLDKSSKYTNQSIAFTNKDYKGLPDIFHFAFVMEGEHRDFLEPVCLEASGEITYRQVNTGGDMPEDKEKEPGWFTKWKDKKKVSELEARETKITEREADIQKREEKMKGEEEGAKLVQWQEKVDAERQAMQVRLDKLQKDNKIVKATVDRLAGHYGKVHNRDATGEENVAVKEMVEEEVLTLEGKTEKAVPEGKLPPGEEAKELDPKMMEVYNERIKLGDTHEEAMDNISLLLPPKEKKEEVK